jgi:succinate dehydrogenase/fumarate reductase flavoprotein subunit
MDSLLDRLRLYASPRFLTTTAVEGKILAREAADYIEKLERQILRVAELEAVIERARRVLEEK